MKAILVFTSMAALCGLSAATKVEDAFKSNDIVSDVVPIAPKNLLNVSYPSGVSVDLGNELTPTQVKDKPNVSWNAEKDAYYTLLMVDPDVPSRANRTLGEVRHWLVMNIPECSVKDGDEVIEYIGSGPMKDTGIHRYVFLVYKQPDGIIVHDEARTSKRSTANRLMTSASAFARKFNLDNPVYGNFYQAQYDAYVDILHASFTE